MAAKTKEKETVVVKTQEEMYLDAERLLKATECLKRDKEKESKDSFFVNSLKTVFPHPPWFLQYNPRHAP